MRDPPKFPCPQPLRPGPDLLRSISPTCPLSCRSCFLAPSSALRQLYSPDSKLCLGTMLFIFFDHFFVSTPSSFPPPLLHFCILHIYQLCPTALSFASTSANHFLSGHLWHRIPIFPKIFFEARCLVLQFWYFVCRCITNCSPSPYNHHSTDSTTPILLLFSLRDLSLDMGQTDPFYRLYSLSYSSFFYSLVCLFISFYSTKYSRGPTLRICHALAELAF